MLIICTMQSFSFSCCCCFGFLRQASYVAQAGLELLIFLPQNAGITVVYQQAQLVSYCCFSLSLIFNDHENVVEVDKQARRNI